MTINVTLQIRTESYHPRESGQPVPDDQYIIIDDDENNVEPMEIDQMKNNNNNNQSTTTKNFTTTMHDNFDRIRHAYIVDNTCNDNSNNQSFGFNIESNNIDNNVLPSNINLNSGKADDEQEFSEWFS
ncbi:unnamed protein product, partial [Rotaria sordida]